LGATVLLGAAVFLGAAVLLGATIFLSRVTAKIAEHVEGMRAAGHKRQTKTKNQRENDSELHVLNS
jgi:hypothetical protein